MSYVSFNDVIELNGILKDKGSEFPNSSQGHLWKTILLDRTTW